MRTTKPEPQSGGIADVLKTQSHCSRCDVMIADKKVTGRCFVRFEIGHEAASCGDVEVTSVCNHVAEDETDNRRLRVKH